MVGTAILYRYLSATNNNGQLQTEMMFIISSGEEYVLEMFVIIQIRNFYHCVYFPKHEKLR